jgi:peptidyl-prolyl cis-trans isomerase C
LETILTDIYVQQKLEQQAQNSKVAQNKEIKQKVKDYKNQLLLKTYIDSIIAKKVNNDAIHNKYIELTSDFSGKKEMHIKHILVKDKGLADKIYKELISKNKKSASFEELAKKYSLDKSNSDLGGDLGYVILDNLDEDFAKAVENLEKGKISKEIKTKFGWHIVKVEGVRKVEIPDFESIKPEIEHRLKQQAMEKIFKDIASEAKIEIIIDLKPEEKLEKKPEEEIAKEDENNDQNKAKNESLDTEKNEAK